MTSFLPSSKMGVWISFSVDKYRKTMGYISWIYLFMAFYSYFATGATFEASNLTFCQGRRPLFLLPASTSLHYNYNIGVQEMRTASDMLSDGRPLFCRTVKESVKVYPWTFFCVSCLHDFVCSVLLHNVLMFKFCILALTSCI